MRKRQYAPSSPRNRTAPAAATGFETSAVVMTPRQIALKALVYRV
jgi:hypothetical protein